MKTKYLFTLCILQFAVISAGLSQGCPDNMADWTMMYNEDYPFTHPDHLRVIPYQPGLKDPVTGMNVFPSNSTEVLWAGSNQEPFASMSVYSDFEKAGYVTPENSKVMLRYSVVTRQIPEGATLLKGTVLTIRYGLPDTYYSDCTWTDVSIDKNDDGVSPTADGQYLYLPWSSYFLDLSSLQTPIRFPQIEFQLTPPMYKFGDGPTEYGYAYLYIDVQCGFPELTPTTSVCVGDPVTFSVPFESPFDDATFWAGENGGYIFRPEITRTYTEPGTYPVTLHYYPATEYYPYCGSMDFTVWITVSDCKVPPFVCETCIPDFSPLPGERYVINAWVRQGDGVGQSTYTDPALQVDFMQGTSTEKFRPSGAIIDGWQQIQGEFTVPLNATKITIKVINDNASQEVFFDDIRVHPFNSSLRSFVYDPVSLRLLAELDERNYASFFEYDEEGRLVRVKKETERGIKTISESRMALRKRKPQQSSAQP